MAAFVNPTMVDVAKRAGVSIASVSRTFSNPQSVREQTRNKVLAAAQELHFSLSRAAGNLKTGISQRIALLVVNEQIEWFTASVIAGIAHVLRDVDYDLAIYPMDSRSRRADFFEQLPVRNNVDAVIVSSFALSDDEIEKLHSVHVPLVGINVPVTDGFDYAVHASDAKGMNMIVKYLAMLGHRHVLYVFPDLDPLRVDDPPERLRTFLESCNALSYMQASVKVVDPQRPTFEAIANALVNDSSITAVCVHQDSLAIPLLFDMQANGIDVPAQLSVVGYDDSTYAQQIGLTTVHQDPYALGERAARQTLRLIQQEHIGATVEQLPVELIVRQTTGAPRTVSLF